MWWLLGAALAGEVVVVDVGGGLYARPDDEQPVFTTVSQVPLRVVSSEGDWLELSTHIEPGPACRRLADVNPAVELRVWARQGDLAQIVTRRIEATGTDGSRVVVHAGYQPPDTSGWARADDWAGIVSAWQAVIPQDAWGTRATPDTERARPEGWELAILDTWDRVLSVRGVRHALPDVEGLSRWGRGSPGWPEAYGTSSGGLLHLALDQQCLEVIGVAPGLPGQLGLAGIGGLIGAMRGHRVSAGADLTWGDGTPAGTTVSTLVWSQARVVGERVCGVVPLTSRRPAGEGPEVCAPTSAVQRVEPPIPSGGAQLTATPPAPGPRGTMGDPIIIGALDRALIDAVVKRRLSQIRYCYQRELMETPGLKGALTVKFTIGTQGEVTEASVKSTTLRHPELEQCVVQRFYTMAFPPPKGGGIVIVSYPFVFAPE
jgi:hypothetical protein